MDQTQLYLLAAVCGFTIFLGLPIALIPRMDEKISSFLSALSVGVLVFLLVEITGKAITTVSGALIDSSIGRISWAAGLGYLALLLGGFSFGLLSLVAFEDYFLQRKEGLAPRQQALHMAWMIAVGIGLHNFSEGLAIGQEYAQGALSLAVILLVGFGLHNATEGFGIAGPLTGWSPSVGLLAAMGLVGGGPTMVGTIVGSMWSSKPLETTCLSLAGGSILYVVAELIHLGRRKGVHGVLMIGLLVGFFLAFGSEIVIDMSGSEAGEYPTTVEKLGPARPPSISAGKAVFQQNCAVCHGANADGKGPAAAGLARHPRNFRDLTFDATETSWDWFDAITHGRGQAMPALADRLSEQDRWNVVAYLHSLNTQP